MTGMPSASKYEDETAVFRDRVGSLALRAHRDTNHAAGQRHMRGPGDGGHFWQGVRTFCEPPVKLRGRRPGIAVPAQIRTGVDHTGGAKTEVQRLRALERPRRERRGGQQHQADGNLHHDQRVARGRSAERAREKRALVSQGGGDLRRRGLHCRGESENHAGCQRQQQRITEHPHIGRQVEDDARPALGQKRHADRVEEANDPRREEQRRRTAQQADDGALDQLIADDAPAAGAERQ